MLQKVFNKRIPLLKFFLKQQLIWVPLLGLAWWALEFPFMRRHSSAYLAAHPEARGQDLAATRKACERFAAMPTSVMNFVEGTRFTQAKRIALKSPYRHLLPPRAGGVAFVLAAMGGMLQSMIDVTIAYCDTSPTLWDLCCGRLGPVRIVVERRPIEPWTTAGDYTEDEAFRRRFQAWLSGIWADKDRKLDQIAHLPRGMPVSWDLPAPFIHERVAVHAEIDGYGHVNNAIYVAWLDDCAWAHSISLGISPELCRRLNRGMAVWRTQLNYIGAVLEGDEIDVATWPVLNDKRLRIDRRFQIRRKATGETLLRALIHYVCIDLHTGKAKRMPPEFMQYAVPPEVIAAIAKETQPFAPGVETR